MEVRKVPIIGFAATSGTGKTTLIEELISIFKDLDIRVGVIKHSHHPFSIDLPGKDSYRFRQAGADQVLIGASSQWALMANTKDNLSLDDYLQSMDTNALDIVLVEGFKQLPFPKIEIYRPSLGQPLLSKHDATIIAIATDDATAIEGDKTLLDLNDAVQIANFIIERFVGVKS
jgi:molybdopterin-guanine dinucleotide biosynthesis protein B